jgi:hypothetical protein
MHLTYEAHVSVTFPSSNANVAAAERNEENRLAPHESVPLHCRDLKINQTSSVSMVFGDVSFDDIDSNGLIGQVLSGEMMTPGPVVVTRESLGRLGAQRHWARWKRY